MLNRPLLSLLNNSSLPGALGVTKLIIIIVKHFLCYTSLVQLLKKETFGCLS
jgi:hypothetical protein